jgi:bacteriocin-like protein
MDNVLEIVEVQELTLAELAQVSGGFGDAAFV